MNDKATLHTILVVDDSPTILIAFKRLLSAEGYVVKTAVTGAEAIEATQLHQPHCILLDYYLPDMTGEQVLASIRLFDQQVQVVIVTAFAQQKPPREMMQRLDIQGFHDKQRDDIDRLMLWVSAALKAHARISAWKAKSDILSYLLEVGKRIHRIQPQHTLMRMMLTEVLALLSHDSLGGLITLGEDPLDILFEQGQHQALDASSTWTDDAQKVIHALHSAQDELIAQRGSLIGVALRPGGQFSGFSLFHYDPEAMLPEAELRLLAQHFSLAMENNRLHGMATVDPITELASRAYFTQRLREAIQYSILNHTPLSVIFIDLDKLKRINDTFGHHIGDQAIALVGKRIRRSIRPTDIAGRLGGDEFVVLAPQTSAENIHLVANRICQRIQSLRFDVRGQSVSLSASLGYGGYNGSATLPTIPNPKLTELWDNLCIAFLSWVDAAAYEAKRLGGGQCAPAGNQGDLDDLLRERIQDFYAKPPALPS
jgi:two-component system, cell cycle response regulator